MFWLQLIKPLIMLLLCDDFYYINTLIQELGSTKTYERISTDERSIVNTNSIDITAKFAVSIKEKQDRLPTLYWLPKLHKRPYKARFIANSSSCTTTVLSKLLTSCLSAVKKNIGLDTMIRFTKGTELTIFGQLKILMMFSINLNLKTFRLPLPLGVWEGLRFVIVALPGFFSYLFF